MRVVLVCLLSSIGFAQFSIHSQPNDDGTGLTVTLQAYYCSQVEPTGAPFSAKKFTEHNRQEADGSRRVEREDNQVLWRDSQWRIRTDVRVYNSQVVFSEICDPVVGFLLLLDSQNKIAHRVAFPPPIPTMIKPPAPLREVKPVAPQRVRIGTQVQAAGPNYRQPEEPELMTMESLGMKSIEGVTAQGERVTSTPPKELKGSKTGAAWERENWHSSYLRMDVLSKFVMRGNETTVRVVNISLGEPELSLFAVPVGYSVVDEKDSFTITLRTR